LGQAAGDGGVCRGVPDPVVVVAVARSLEKNPDRATFSTALRVHARGSR